MDLTQEVQAWIADDPDPKTAAQLQQWLDSNNEVELRASFNGFLQFGTAGLRGPIRPGPSGMNRAVVGRTAAGLVAYMKERNLTSVVIGRDARYGSEDFTFETAEIMSGAGMKVYVLPRPLPTPVLAFATNELKSGHVSLADWTVPSLWRWLFPTWLEIGQAIGLKRTALGCPEVRTSKRRAK